ncbi:MAG: homocysteine methyltransferase [Bryobacteraceae bacterium]|nr:homocysteine methyltransferase [Bryobacteraceae bacterium]
MASPSLPTTSPSPILDLLDGFRRSKAMFSAVSLGVFDALEGNPQDCAALAAKFNADHDALERLLNSCVALNLLTFTDAKFANTEVASVYLTRQSERTLSAYVRYSDQALFPLWSNLGDAIREGSNRWNQTFGPGADLFSSHFFRTDESMRDFLQGMHGLGLLSSPINVAAFDLSRFGRLVDLGGATGHFAIEASRRYPQLACAVFDLPRVITIAAEFVAAAKAPVDTLAGDFFADPLPPADLYSLGRILHDWSEDKIVKLLLKICGSLPHGGGLLVLEKVLDDDRTGPATALMQSLNMLICTEGKERNLGEYRGILEQTGFTQIEVRRTGAPVDVILAIKP